MKAKKFLTCLLTAVLAVSLCACFGTQAEKPKLIIGSNEYAPYSYTDETGEPAGLDVELAREACARMGYEPVFRKINWDSRDELLTGGGVDCLWSCFSMDGQESGYDWVGPYMRSRQVVAVLSDSELQRLTQLQGKMVAVRVGSKAETIFLRHAETNIPSVQTVFCLNSMDEVATSLRNGYVDAVAGYGAAVREALREGGISYRFLDEELGHANLGIAFARSGDRELQRKLTQALKEMQADGTTERILEGYGIDIEKALGSIRYE